MSVPGKAIKRFLLDRELRARGHDRDLVVAHPYQSIDVRTTKVRHDPEPEHALIAASLRNTSCPRLLSGRRLCSVKQQMPRPSTSVVPSSSNGVRPEPHRPQFAALRIMCSTSLRS